VTEAKLDTSRYVVFTLDGLFYAVRLSAVSRVIRAVEITPLPKAPSIVLGVINLGGQIIPVVDIRKRFRLPERELELTDQLIVARAFRSDANADAGRFLALVVDEVMGVQDLSPQETVAAETILSGMEHLEGVAKTERGLVLIHDLRTFLSLEEESAIGELLSKGT